MKFPHVRWMKAYDPKRSRRLAPRVEWLEARHLLSITQLTNGASDHRWPSLNNHGDYVYSAKDANGFWQIFEDGHQLTSDNHNNEYPSISDGGDIVYFKDGGSSGIGWQVIRRSASGSEGTLEFSSRNIFSGAHRDANKYTGISSNGNSISGFNFYSFGFSSFPTQRFNVSNVGQLPFDFSGSYNYPDINAQGDLLFASTGGFFSSPAIYKTTTSGPFPGTPVGSGTMGRINDSGDIVAVSGDLNSPGSIRILSGPNYSQNTNVGNGSWADIDNNKDVIFENIDSHGFRQIYLSSSVEPDLSVTTPAWTNPRRLDFTYSVSGGNLEAPATVGLYWSADTSYDPGQDTLAYATPTQTVQSQAPYSLSVNSDQLTPAPQGSKYLLAVIDPANVVRESDEPNYPNQFGANNTASVAYDPITAVAATSPDPVDISFKYDVEEAALGQAFDVAVFRSASPTFSFASAIQVGPDFLIPPVDASDQSSVSLGEHTVVLNVPMALHPDPTHEYVFVVVDPEHVYGEPSNAIREAHFRKFVLGATVHGFQLTGGLLSLPPWETEATTALRQLGYNQVLPFDWRSTSNDSRRGVTQSEGLMLANEIQALADFLVQTQSIGQEKDVVDLHLVGHSRGAVVISQALVDLANTIDPVLMGGFKTMTMLDPHPANNYYAQPDYSASFLGRAVVSSYKKKQEAMMDPQVVIPSSVNKAELYFQHTPTSMFHGVFNSESYLNLWGEDTSPKLITNQSSEIIQAYNLTSVVVPVLGPIGHSEVPLYYVRFALPNERNSWYRSGPHAEPSVGVS